MEREGAKVDNSNGPTSLLTRRYRSNVLQLASSSNSRVAWETAQHVLDELWKDNDTNEEGKTLIYGCQGCGYRIHPGWKGTSLRVNRTAKKPSRSLLRRLQRKKKKLALLQKKQAKDQSHRQQKEQTPGPRQQDRLILIQDDPNVVVDRHHLVICCGRCQARVRLKGLKRQQPTTKRDLVRKNATVVVKSKTTLMKKAPPHNSTFTNDSLDFVQLPPSSSSSSSKPAPRTLPQGGKQKKKKKQAPTKANKLMTFLSSLND